MKKRILLETNNLNINPEAGSAAVRLYLRFMKGETVALLGEMDSGRSAFFDYLCGMRKKSSGSVWCEANENTEQWLRKNLFVISDRSFSKPSGKTGISIIENLYLIRSQGTAKLIWNPGRLEEECRFLLSQVGIQRDPHEDIGALSLPEHLKLQFAKSLLSCAKMIALEEDFEGFSPEDIEEVAITVARLKAQKELCVIWSTNGLRGVTELCDRIIVFSHGTAIKQFSAREELNADEIEAIVHRRYEPEKHDTETVNTDMVFCCEDLKLGQLPFTLSLRRGEIISIVEYDTDAKNRLFQILCGYTPHKQLFLEGKKLPANWQKNRERYPVCGIFAFGTDGVFTNLSLAENLLMPGMRKASRPGFFVPKGAYKAVWIDWCRNHKDNAVRIDEMNRSDLLAMQLESRLIFNPKVLILMEPFLHLDQRGRGIIAQYFHRFHERGTSIITISSSRTNYLGADAQDLDAGLFDRIIYTENGMVFDNEQQNI